MSYVNDPIADYLTRIRNAYMANLKTVAIPPSKMKKAITEVLKGEGYIDEYTEEGEGKNKSLVIKLKYYKEKPVIEKLERISKPSCRIYADSDNIPKPLGGMGIAVMSTSKGVISSRMALKERIGGEVLCSVY
ncbi:MAG: 30S ribosomal protein S8 [Verrucomicrobiota bacterium]|nr:30S ribosomal protein S8 [Verrucomicrobiota bacterium]